MKRIVFIVLVIASVLLTACVISEEVKDADRTTQTPFNDEQQNTSSAESEPTVSPALASLATPKPTVTTKPTPTQTPEPIVIPDIILDTAEKVNSNYILYEDEENIYYLWKNNNHKGDLFIIDKENEDVIIVKSDCYHFSFSKGKLYFATSQSNENEIKMSIDEYDVLSGNINTIKTINRGLYNLSFFSNKIYFTANADLEEGWEPYEDFYAVNINGSGMKRIQEDVGSFCIYNDRIFCTTSMGIDGGQLFEYEENIPADERDLGETIDWVFDISFDKVICTELYGDSVSYLYDINTGERTNLPFYYYATVAGQYIIDLERDAKTDIPTILTAYDFLEEKEYILFDFAEIIDEPVHVEIHSSGANIYICIETSYNQTLEMYRLNIEDGKSVIEHIVTLVNEE